MVSSQNQSANQYDAQKDVNPKETVDETLPEKPTAEYVGQWEFKLGISTFIFCLLDI